MNYLYNTPIIPMSQLGYLFFLRLKKNEARIISCFVLFEYVEILTQQTYMLLLDAGSLIK